MTLTGEAAGLEPVTAWPGAGSSVTTVTAQGDISTPAVSELINRSDDRWEIRLARTGLSVYLHVCVLKYQPVCVCVTVLPGVWLPNRQKVLLAKRHAVVAHLVHTHECTQTHTQTHAHTCTYTQTWILKSLYHSGGVQSTNSQQTDNLLTNTKQVVTPLCSWGCSSAPFFWCLYLWCKSSEKSSLFKKNV